MKHDDPMFIPYAAGLFDGEGSIGIYGKRKQYQNGTFGVNFGLFMNMTNTNREVVDLFLARWGGSFDIHTYANPKHRQTYRWRAAAKRVVAVLDEIYPYLVIKKAQADVAYEFQTLLHTKGRLKTGLPRGGQSLSIEAAQARIDCAERMKMLKVA